MSNTEFVLKFLEQIGVTLDKITYDPRDFVMKRNVMYKGEKLILNGGFSPEEDQDFAALNGNDSLALAICVAITKAIIDYERTQKLDVG